jgi:hypothetical protein
MLKPTSNYKMSKQTKTSLAMGRFKDAHQAGAWKRAMIDAELQSKIVVKPAKKEQRGTSNYTTTSNSATASE